ncbi:MAG: hypothetical protein RI953_1157 [Pseudomonadota bacterium]|jgi:hypothetical protein
MKKKKQSHHILGMTPGFCMGFATLLLGCSQSPAKPIAPYRAIVVNFVPGVAPAQGTWEMGEKILSTLEDPDTMKGAHFDILTGQKLSIDATVGSLVSGKITGNSTGAAVRYDVKNNVIVARDTSTLLLFSTFHAFEKMFDSLESISGLKVETLKNAIGGKYKIYFEPTIEEGSSQSNARLTFKLNAAFYSEADNFLLFRRSELEKVPLAANIKVISHEFGHALFKYSFFEQKSERCSAVNENEIAANTSNKFFPGRFATEFAISGFNEGYSDFNSYAVTGDVNPIEGSLEIEDLDKRSLAGKAFTFSQLKNTDVCDKKFYCIGTLFARALYKTSQIYQGKPAELQAFSRRVFSALTKTGLNMKSQPALDLLPLPRREVASCQHSNTISISYDGAVSGAFLAAFLKGLSVPEERAALCNALVENFANEGFPTEARGACTP